MGDQFTQIPKFDVCKKKKTICRQGLKQALVILKEESLSCDKSNLILRELYKAR